MFNRVTRPRFLFAATAAALTAGLALPSPAAHAASPAGPTARVGTPAVPSFGLGLDPFRQPVPQSKPNCGCLEYVKYRMWSTRSPRYGVDQAYQMMRNVVSSGKTGAWHMADRGYSYTESPGVGSVVIMDRGAAFQVYDGRSWRNTSASGASGHAGWIAGSVSTSGNVRIFKLRHANMAISGTGVSDGTGCSNVRDSLVSLQGTTRFSYYR